MFKHVINKLETALVDWEAMKKASYDESEDFAERFELHFYEFIDELKCWFQQIERKPTTIEEAEDLAEIKEILDRLPEPLVLNFYNELDLIIEGIEQKL